MEGELRLWPQCPVILVLSNRCVSVLISRGWLWRWVVTKKTQKESVRGQKTAEAENGPCDINFLSLWHTLVP